MAISIKYKFQYKEISLLLITMLCYLVIGATGATAQVHMAPIALYLDEGNQTDRMVVRNSSDKPQELTIEIIYGYPDTDRDGNIYLKKFDSVPDSEPSAKDWIRVYPRHLVLPAGEQQTIRFSARPPAGLPQGEYWARPTVSVRNAQENSTKVNENISATINLVRRSILSINYRNGNVNTGVTIRKLNAEVSEDRLILSANLERKGNAAYLGHTDIRVFDSSGKLQKHIQNEIAIYRPQDRIFDIDVSGLAKGTYRAELSLGTEQRAEENKDILQAAPTAKTINFTVK